MNKPLIKDQSSAADATYDHVLKYTGVFGGVQGLKIIVNVVRGKLTALLLGPVGMGLNAIYANLSELINSCTNLGLAFGSVQHLSELFETGSEAQMERFVRTIRTWTLWTAIVASLLCAFFVVPFLSLLQASADGIVRLLSTFGLNLEAVEFPITYWQAHRTTLYLLSALVFVLPIEASECAIIKGVRKLKRLAVVEGSCAVAIFLFTIPFYYVWGLKGIALALVASNAATAVIHLLVSTRLFPYRVSLFSAEVLRRGLPLVRIGVPYVLAAVAGTATATMVYYFLGGEQEVGLYKAGYGLMVTYAGMVFVAVEADYFPRLSSVSHAPARLNATVNQQIDVCLLLMTPLLIVFAMLMPWVIRLLFREDFMAIQAMSVSAVYYMFFRAAAVPMAYVALAKGETGIYLVMEIIYDIVFVGLILLGYRHGGLTGVGVALSVASLFDLLQIRLVYGWRYRIRLKPTTWRLFLGELVCLTAVVPFCYQSPYSGPKYIVGAAAMGVSLLLAYRLLSRESGLVGRILKHFRSHGDHCDCC